MDELGELRDTLKDRYRIERELGRGGSAVVYLARDLKHDRQVALKVLRSDLAAVLGSERFLHEIQITAGLQHPHILPLHDSGAAGGILYYVMPFVEGESLRDRLRREKQLPIRDAVRIAREVADALAYAHEKNIVHRDIKPENILLSGGHAVVSDFGIAQAIQAAGGDTTLVQGSVSGTPAYMSPEQAGGEPVDARSDIYSLGCVLFELLVGAPPFSAPTVQGLLKLILSSPPPDLRDRRDTVPEPLEAAVRQALAKLPADRFTSAREFAAALGPEPDTTHAGTGLAAALPGTARPGGSGLAPALGIFLSTALAVAAAAYGLVRWIGLPDWVLYGAVLLLLAGLPVVVVTGVVQGGAGGAPRWLTWRKTVLGGVLAFGLWVLVTGGYVISRAMGVGPGASLVSAGILDRQDEILVADFENQTPDSLLGDTMKEALSIDLAQSRAVRVVPGSRIVQVLERMEKPKDTRLDADLAREIAVRDGIKAVLAGQVLSTGSAYIVTARLLAPETGDVLSAHRETAKDESGLIDAVDRLSRDIREKIGESLKSIRSQPNLAAVTTTSLEALQKYSQAVRAEEFQGRSTEAIGLLDQATELDSTFAMAYRKLAVILGNYGLDESRRLDALTRAYELRNRLTPRERLLTAASYHTFFREYDQAIAAYRQMLDLDSLDSYPLNNLSTLYATLGNGEQSLEYAKRALGVDHSINGYFNVIGSLITLNRPAEAESAYAALKKAYPESPNANLLGAVMASVWGDYATSESRATALADAARGNPMLTSMAAGVLESLASVHGRLKRAAEYRREAVDAFERAGRISEALDMVTGTAYQDAFIRNRPDLGRTELDRALEKHPLKSMNPVDRPYLDLAAAYAAVGAPKRARELLAEFNREVDPRIRRSREPGIHDAQGSIALAEGRAQDAVTEFREMERTRDPMNGFSPILAVAYDAAGQPDSALAAYERYVNTPAAFRLFWDSTFLAGSYRRLAELCESRGEMAKAAEYYRKFADLWKDADPELQPRVQAAERKAKLLAGGD